MLRLSANWTVIEVAPCALNEVISLTPAIWPSWRSSGVATEAAMVAGLAPGSVAVTWMVGKSMAGSGATGRRGNTIRPSTAMAAISSVVATGRAMNGADRFTGDDSGSVDRQAALVRKKQRCYR